MSLFCYECGEIIGDINLNQMLDISNYEIKCNFCESKKRFKDCYYPHFSVKDFIKTIDTMYEQNKKDLTENIKSAYKIFDKIKDANDNFTLEEYTKIYHILDHLLEDEVKYSIDIKSNVYANLEDTLVEMYPSDLAINIVASLHFIKTPFRKPIVILIASTIELLFNIYYKDTLRIGKIDEHDNPFLSITGKIKYLNKNRNKSLKQHIERYDKDFYDLWDGLRIIRNKVIHSNSLYISNKMIEDYMNLLKNSITVFLNITSELYRNDYTSNSQSIINS
ncbi:hypothetical protein [Bacillus thuringiensis]|uniref:hypothetical protein n=1 Tax=Bacillus thuringiensis TaxID=1428 RepID=UPI000BFD2694|nr:hypothetical protein [Bacillus thuringiensis]PGO45471.1 hypothetical protein CN986_30985 [Bacillus thuringiensis]